MGIMQACTKPSKSGCINVDHVNKVWIERFLKHRDKMADIKSAFAEN